MPKNHYRLVEHIYEFMMHTHKIIAWITFVPNNNGLWRNQQISMIIFFFDNHKYQIKKQKTKMSELTKRKNDAKCKRPLMITVMRPLSNERHRKLCLFNCFNSVYHMRSKKNAFLFFFLPHFHLHFHLNFVFFLNASHVMCFLWFASFFVAFVFTYLYIVIAFSNMWCKELALCHFSVWCQSSFCLIYLFHMLCKRMQWSIKRISPVCFFCLCFFVINV